MSDWTFQVYVTDKDLPEKVVCFVHIQEKVVCFVWG